MTFPEKIVPCVQYLPDFDEKILEKSAKYIFRKFKIYPKQTLYDKRGRWGFRYTNYIMVAKKEPYGSIVSVHEQAVLKAREHDIVIIIYLASNKKYYWIDPYIIDQNCQKNYRGGESMLNFDIKLLKPLEW